MSSVSFLALLLVLILLVLILRVFDIPIFDMRPSDVEGFWPTILTMLLIGGIQLADKIRQMIPSMSVPWAAVPRSRTDSFV
jgi:hypothetical protein